VTLSDPATRLVRPTTMIACNSLFRTIYYGAWKLKTTMSHKLLTLTKVNLPWINGKNLYCNILKIQPNGSKVFFPFRSTLRKLGNLEVNRTNRAMKTKFIDFSWLSHSCLVHGVRAVTRIKRTSLCAWVEKENRCSKTTLGALSKSERVKSKKDELYLFLTLFLSLDDSTRLRLPMFSRRGFKGKEIFLIPFAKFLICYATYSSH